MDNNDCRMQRLEPPQEVARELNNLGIQYQIVYGEEQPELVNKYNVHHSSNLTVDSEVKLHGQPAECELRECLNC